MIFQVNTFYATPSFFDEATNPNARVEAEALLAQVRIEVLEREATRFSICATFVNGNDTIWRELQDSDPENTICQVFDTLSGSYTQVSNKTEAYVLNEQKKQNFLVSCGLGAIVELEEMPQPQSQSHTIAKQTE